MNRFRKQKSKTQKTQKADENRAAFGRTKSEKARDALDKRNKNKHLDDHKRND